MSKLPMTNCLRDNVIHVNLTLTFDLTGQGHNLVHVLIMLAYMSKVTLACSKSINIEA